MIEEILNLVGQLKTPGFFITTEISREGETIPSGIESYIYEKLTLISQGASARKYVYQQEGWRIIFTFFPTNRVVDERYALKNKVLFKKIR